MEKVFVDEKEILANLPAGHQAVVRRKSGGLVVHGTAVPSDHHQTEEVLRKLLAGARYYDAWAKIIGPSQKPS